MSVTTDTPERRSAWIPWIFVGFFVVVFAVNGTMVYFAATSWTGMYGDDGSKYRQGLEYNQMLEAVAAQAAMGWQVDHSFERTEPGQGHLSITLQDAHGNQLTDAAVRAELIRPTHSGADFDVPLTHTGQGRYEVDILFPHPGQWQVDLTADHERGTYRLTDRVIVR